MVRQIPEDRSDLSSHAEDDPEQTAKSQPRGLFYGWVIVGVATLGVFLSGPGQTYSVSMFIDPLIETFGWSRSLVSGMYSAGTLTAGLFMTVIGRTVDRKGYRPTLTVIALCFAAALFFMSRVSTPAALFVGFMMIRTFGQGSLTLIPNSMVPQWFIRRRGRALSFLAIGGALSAACLPYVNLIFIENFGWRFTWMFWAVVLAAVMAPVAWFLTRERPEAMGLVPDGSPAHPPRSGARVTPLEPEEAWDVPEAIRTKAFWIILFTVSIPSMVSTGAQFHHMSILAENGVTAQAAAVVFTVAAATRMVLTPLAGYMCDRYPIHFVLSGAMLMQALNLVFLLFTTSFSLAVALGIIQGLRMAFLVLVGGVIWPHFFGRRYLASIRGVTTAGMVISSALGPLPFGLGYDLFGGYTEVLLLMTLLPLVGAIAVLFVRRPQKNDDGKWASERAGTGTPTGGG